MIKFNIPTNLNGAELRQELISAGVAIIDKPSSLVSDGEGNLWLNIADKDEAKARVVVDAHNGTTVASEPTVADKLKIVGLNLEDLKTALGL